MDGFRRRERGRDIGVSVKDEKGERVRIFMLAFRRDICRTLRRFFCGIRQRFDKSDFRGRYRGIRISDDRRRKGLADKRASVQSFYRRIHIRRDSFVRGRLRRGFD